MADAVWRLSPYVRPEAIRVAQALEELARERLGTFTYESDQGWRVVVRRRRHTAAGGTVIRFEERSDVR